MDYINTILTFFNDGDKSYKSLQEEIKRDIERHRNSLDKLEKCLKIVENLKFKPGSVVVHKQLGNGLVLCPYIKEMMEMNGHAFSYDEILDKFQNDLGYIVQFVKNDNGKISFVKEIVKEDDIMPYTEASKILYGE
jgi:hypothetical protein